MKYFIFSFLLLGINFRGLDTNVAINSILKTDTVSKWKLAKNKDGVKVYTRSTEGIAVKEFRAQTSVLCKIKELESLLMEAENYPAWQANISTAKILKQVNNTEQYIYYTSHLPWPVSDRDVVVNSIMSKSKEGVVTVNITGTPNYIDRKDDFLRIEKIVTKWTLTPKGNGEIGVLQQVTADPGGNIPTWVINMLIVDGPFETFTNLRAKFKK
jgi:hypothetical protein